MSHQMLKNIKVSKTLNKVFFMEKSNNTTSPYRIGDATIPDFLHCSVGNIFQYSSKTQISQIVKEYEDNLKVIAEDATAVWWEIEHGNIDTLTEEIRTLFYKTCDKIANLV